MIRSLEELLSVTAPFGANGGQGGGGGGGADPPDGGRGGGSVANVRGIIAASALDAVENLAAGRIPRQEAILCYTEEAPGGNGHLTTWFRSFHQGRFSGYRWLIPTPPCRYRPDEPTLFRMLEQRLNLASASVHEERVENGVMLSTKAEAVNYIKGFDFDLSESAIDHYIAKKWMFLGLQVYGTYMTREPFYRMVSNPVRVKTMTADRNIVYPMVLTGSSKAKGGSQKFSEIRLYVITRYRLASYPKVLSPTFEGVVEFDLGDWFVTVLEGTVTADQMTQDFVIELDRTRMLYE